MSENEADDLNAALAQAKSEILTIDETVIRSFNRKLGRVLKKAFHWMCSFVRKFNTGTNPTSTGKLVTQKSSNEKSIRKENSNKIGESNCK